MAGLGGLRTFASEKKRLIDDRKSDDNTTARRLCILAARVGVTRATLVS
jgi:hypothetical protein